jgi:hypothetical protein
VAQQVGLPRQQQLIELVRAAGDLGEQGAVGNERGFHTELGGDAVAVGLDAILQLDLGLRERNVIGVAARAARERLGIAGEASAEKFGRGAGRD